MGMESFFQEVSLFWTAFVSTLTLMKLSVVMSATIMGIVVGAIPGLTATMALALLINLTYGMELGVAIAFLLGGYVGAVMGGCNAAIMINIPGTPSAAATALDGFILAKRGEGGIAIGTGVIASFIGMMISITLLIFLTPFLYKIALRFGQWEYFLLSVFGIMICGNLSTGKDPIKGWVVGFLGFFTAMIGLDQIYAYPRFTFGSLQLKAGITLIPALIGYSHFGILIVLQEQFPIRSGEKSQNCAQSKSHPLAHSDRHHVGTNWCRNRSDSRSGRGYRSMVAMTLGTRSKHGHLYGTGCLEGVAAPKPQTTPLSGGQ
jgi:putative tricarboxylic transport membrane protein